MMQYRAALIWGVMVWGVGSTGPSGSAAAAGPWLEKVDLFAAGKDDYALYRIPGIVVTAKGTVLAYCEARRTGKSDWDTIDIMLRRSTDGGRTWEPCRKIADVPGPKSKNPVAIAQNLGRPEDVTYNNPVAIADSSGAVHFLFCLEYARCFSLRSDDDGLTWSPPREITATFDAFRPQYDWKVLATGPGHGIQLKNGRLLVPVWLSTGTGGHAHRPSVTATIYSDDHGATWHRGEIAVPNTDEWIFPNETAAVELDDGRVMLNVRSESKPNRRLVTISPDGATGWSTPRFDDGLPEPICMASLVRMPGGPNGRSRLLFSNPDNLARADGKESPGKGRDRKNVTIRLSEDDGRTWPIARSLEPEWSGYSDLAIAGDGTILCFYERGSTDGKNSYKTGLLTVARFNLDWLAEGDDQTAATPAAAAPLASPEPPQGESLQGESPPNVVIVFADDLGYGDLGCYGATGYSTPHLDRMAAEGMKFTSFCVAQAVCGASRAALLTGCYPNRLGMLGAPGPQSKHGIHDRELLLPELVRQKGYATAMFGKWHLGHHRPFLPLQHGFDEYFGLPYSNDMWPFHPTNPTGYPDLPLIEGNEIAHPKVTPDDQKQLTTGYTERAVRFIESHADRPFFLYVAHNMPHVPLAVSDRFAGKSDRGLFGDVISEIDWGVGEILAALKRRGIDDRTLVLFTSDNGPWLSYGDHAGSAGPLREGKGTTFEGGVRVPCLMRWPGRIPAGAVCEELAATIDLLPTVAGLIGAELPKHSIDGRDIWPLMSGQSGAKSPHDSYLYYWGNRLEAIRSGDWKLHFPHDYRSLTGPPGHGGQPGGYSQQQIGRALYNLRDDVGETRDVKADHPEICARLDQLADAARAELGDAAQKLPGRAIRLPAVVRP